MGDRIINRRNSQEITRSQTPLRDISRVSSSSSSSGGGDYRLKRSNSEVWSDVPSQALETVKHHLETREDALKFLQSIRDEEIRKPNIEKMARELGKDI